MITDLQIAQSFSDNQKACGGLEEDYFGLLYLEKEHGVPHEKAVNQVAFGGNDYGLDGFHFDEAKRNLYFFQFKYTPSYGQFKVSMQRSIDIGMDRIFGSPNKDPNKNQILMQLRSCLIENRTQIDQVCFRFVFTGDPNDAERSRALEKLREDLENKRFYVEQFFHPRSVRFVVEFRSSTGKIGGLRATEASAKFSIAVSDNISAVAQGGERLLSFFIPLVELHAMHQALGARFFDRNVRYGLGESETVNRAISKALREIVIDATHDPAVFAFNHNGVTLYAEGIEEEFDELNLSSPRLLNGAQTVTTFAGFLKENQDNPNLSANEDRLRQIMVLCKVISNADDNFVTRVTINNNRQNPVEPWNLHANDMIQLELQDKFAEDLQIYYERQENAFDQISAEDLDDYGIKVDSKAVQMLKLTQTFLLTDGTISRLSELRRVFEDDKVYESVLNKDRLHADSRHILLCYKIERKLRKLTDDIKQKGPNKYHFAPRARNLIWALGCQGVLNDKDKLEELAGSDGHTLVISANYSAYLSKLATGKIAPLLAAVMADKEYTDSIAEDKLGFLRTDAAFQKCMKLAYSKWKWVQKRLI